MQQLNLFSHDAYIFVIIVGVAGVPEDWLSISSVLPNCGLPDVCPDNHVSITLNSNIQQEPRICVAGKMSVQLLSRC